MADKIYYYFSQENSKITNMYNNIEYHDSVTLYGYVCKVCWLKKPYNKPLMNIDRLVNIKLENIRLPRSFMYEQDLGLIFSRNDSTLG